MYTKQNKNSSLLKTSKQTKKQHTKITSKPNQNALATPLNILIATH